MRGSSNSLRSSGNRNSSKHQVGSLDRVEAPLPSKLLKAGSSSSLRQADPCGPSLADGARANRVMGKTRRTSARSCSISWFSR